ncbi:TPA: antA/AntB antirepressor family protein [Enterobacter hormaechei]|nr:antA/AntB antirepressor family protein [Enterobacter hormaechei]HBU6226963.1 antA/AntB antirepressor family protein [Enterobacter hormaechei]HBU7103198.1 antA/AntB antirepressor family protein [Enterobacter hormaechei]HBU8404392.1 antA/AntB antirepressor family protein [Enterobacter hormaechei]HBU8499687.1 antA/AntB antirepressor family protein [Enterobacter hormaechei]
MGKLPELIPVTAGSIDGQPAALVSAKRLHSFLGVGRDFTTWIKGRISQYGFTAGVDFTVVENLSAPVSGSSKYRQQIAHDYLITIDMGKELAMVERNEKGREVRRYFINC